MWFSPLDSKSAGWLEANTQTITLWPLYLLIHSEDVYTKTRSNFYAKTFKKVNLVTVI